MRVHTPGEAAEVSGFSLDTLRYYERIGLLPEIRRTAAGHRVFSTVDLQWLALVRCLRDTGMPLAEMLEFTRLFREGTTTQSDRLAVLETHEQRVEAQIRRLEEHLAQLRSKIDTYRNGTTWTPGSTAAPS
jgi:DNA-binding transcriptional MerR regulator